MEDIPTVLLVLPWLMAVWAGLNILVMLVALFRLIFIVEFKRTGDK